MTTPPHPHHHHHDGCSCGHDHSADAKPRLAAPLSLLAAGTPLRMLLAGIAVAGLWAATFWAMRGG